ncbi:MAG: tRNA (adenosine(37)-N6)-threonylcarbamoyltransferase complex dimerization subunit type 1 TsaB [Armatimonadota bacterium]|nr:MAG: tRNA (adenosine(37)-N6)-threonylcarbamoyltransferase complex dimerization subunit type 1 TsaB [Armatimonadota bacterium]
MTLLAIETATDIAGAALLDHGSLRASLAFRPQRDVCQRLLPRIQEMMGEAGVSIEKVAAIAVGRGPGSFTGIRIGVSIAKGMALALGVPLFGVSTLAACAYPALGSGGIACALIPAHGDELYAGLFRAGETLEPIEEDVLTASDLIARLAHLGERVTFAPVAAQARAVLPLKELNVEHSFLPAEITWHLATWVGRLAAARLEAGEAGDGIGLAPVYLRPSQAELQADGTP